jgi:hypothetical protein
MTSAPPPPPPPLTKMNVDLQRERANASIDLAELKSFLGEQIYLTRAKHQQALKYSKHKYIFY